MNDTRPFWKRKRLEEMTPQEWESLCDGCAKCCLHKLEDEDTGEIAYTNVACRLLDLGTSRCSNYKQRKRLVPDCLKLAAKDISRFQWLPPTCAYRLVAEGKDLPSWHPLITGDPLSTVKSGASVCGWAVSERNAGPLENHILDSAP